MFPLPLLARVRRLAPVQRVHAFRVRLVEVERVQGGGPRRLGRGPERRRPRAFLRGAFRDDDARGGRGGGGGGPPLVFIPRARRRGRAEVERARARVVPRGVADRERPVRPRRSRGEVRVPRARRLRAAGAAPSARRAASVGSARAGSAPPRQRNDPVPLRRSDAPPFFARDRRSHPRRRRPRRGGCGCGTPRRRARESAGGTDARRPSARRATTRRARRPRSRRMGKTRRRGGSDDVSCCCCRDDDPRSTRAKPFGPTVVDRVSSFPRSMPRRGSILIGSAVSPALRDRSTAGFADARLIRRRIRAGANHRARFAARGAQGRSRRVWRFA